MRTQKLRHMSAACLLVAAQVELCTCRQYVCMSLNNQESSRPSRARHNSKILGAHPGYKLDKSV